MTDERVKELESALRGLKTRGDVEAYLRHAGIDFHWEAADSAVYALLRNVGGSWLVKKDIQIVVHVDSAGMVRDVSVQPILTGP